MPIYKKNKKKVRLIIHNQYPIVERTTSVRTHFLYISSPSREILHCFHLNVTPCMRISRRSSRLTFEKTFLIYVATTWRRTRFLDRFHSQVSPDLSTFPHCPLPPALLVSRESSSAWTHLGAPNAPSPRPRTIVQAHSTIRFPYGAFPASSLSMASASIREIFGIEILLSKYRIYPFLEMEKDRENLVENGWMLLFDSWG